MRILPSIALGLIMAGCVTPGTKAPASGDRPADYANAGCAVLAATVASCSSGFIHDGDACRVARVGLAFCQASGVGALVAGSGYDPRQRGLTRSCFRLDAVNGPETCVPIDFSADPATAVPGSVEFAQLYERRWGRCTLNGCANDTPPHFFKRWRGPGMEVRDTLARALEWSCRAGIFGSVHAPDCAPTETEITDLQATGDAPVWEAYLKAEVPGYRPDNRIAIADPGLPHGEGQDRDPFWRLPRYYVNSAFPPAPRCGDGNKDPGETCVTCPADAGACPPPPPVDPQLDCSGLEVPPPSAPQFVATKTGTDSTGISGYQLIECRGGSLPTPEPVRPALSVKTRETLAKLCPLYPKGWTKIKAACVAAISETLGVNGTEGLVNE